MNTNPSGTLDTLEVLVRSGRPLTEQDRGALIAVSRHRPDLAGRVAGVRRLDEENTQRADRRQAKRRANLEAQHDAEHREPTARERGRHFDQTGESL